MSDSEHCSGTPKGRLVDQFSGGLSHKRRPRLPSVLELVSERSRAMSRSNVNQSNEVWERIKETAEHHPRLSDLRNHVDAIADELAATDAFDYVDNRWVLSDRAWTDWLFSGADEKYYS